MCSCLFSPGFSLVVLVCVSWLHLAEKRILDLFLFAFKSKTPINERPQTLWACSSTVGRGQIMWLYTSLVKISFPAEGWLQK